MNLHLTIIFFFGTVNAIIVACTHSLLFKEKLILKRDVLLPFIIGLLSSVITFSFAFMIVGLYRWASLLHDIGFYSIFPLWTIAMSRHLLKQQAPTGRHMGSNK